MLFLKPINLFYYTNTLCESFVYYVFSYPFMYVYVIYLYYVDYLVLYGIAYTTLGLELDHNNSMPACFRLNP